MCNIVSMEENLLVEPIKLENVEKFEHYGTDHKNVNIESVSLNENIKCEAESPLSYSYTENNQNVFDTSKEYVVKEEKYSPLEDSKKFKIDILENEVNYTNDHHKVLGISIYEECTEPNHSNVNERRTNLVSGEDKIDQKSFRSYQADSLIANQTLKNKIYECEQCKKCFTFWIHLRNHILHIHEKTIKLECEQCSGKFSRKSYLRRHIREVHERIRNYKCGQCNSTFYEMSYLKTHITTVHEGIRKFECRQCSKMFSTISHVKRHISSVHQKIMKYNCGHCQRMFSDMSGLKSHIRIVHEGIKKFACEQCNRMFSRKSHLKIHKCCA